MYVCVCKQASVESLQCELAVRDAEIEQLRTEVCSLSGQRDEALSAVNTLRTAAAAANSPAPSSTQHTGSLRH